MKKAHYDTTTKKLLGWYSDDIHKTIPTPFLEVTDKEWQTAIEANANYIDVANKKVIFKDLRTQIEIDKDAQDSINAEARAYLASTDWMVIREVEGGTAIPANIKTLRAEARARVV